MISGKKACVALLLGLLSILIAGAQDAIDRMLEQALDGLAPPSSEALVVSVGNFTFADKNVGSSFSRYLEDKLSGSIVEHLRFELFARDKLDEILEAQEMSLSDLVDQSTSVRIGMLKAVRGIISGRFFEAGTQVKLFLELADIEMGTVSGKVEVDLPKSSIPPTVSLLPDNYNDALFVIEELSEVQNADNESFVVKTWVKRGNGGTYRDGEELIVNFYANRDCYIKVYHIDVDRKVQLIFPNQFYSDNFVRRGRIHRIPDGRYPFRFMLGAPYGAEFIKVVASTLQFDDIEQSFQEMGTASKELITRGLNVQVKKEQVTEEMISYTIIEPEAQERR